MGWQSRDVKRVRVGYGCVTDCSARCAAGVLRRQADVGRQAGSERQLCRACANASGLGVCVIPVGLLPCSAARGSYSAACMRGWQRATQRTTQRAVSAMRRQHPNTPHSTKQQRGAPPAWWPKTGCTAPARTSGMRRQSTQCSTHAGIEKERANPCRRLSRCGCTHARTKQGCCKTACSGGMCTRGCCTRISHLS